LGTAHHEAARCIAAITHGLPALPAARISTKPSFPPTTILTGKSRLLKLTLLSRWPDLPHE